MLVMRATVRVEENGKEFCGQMVVVAAHIRNVTKLSTQNGQDGQFQNVCILP